MPNSIIYERKGLLSEPYAPEASGNDQRRLPAISLLFPLVPIVTIELYDNSTASNYDITVQQNSLPARPFDR
jgi:hypothetical protein